jgi:hypothetical protein
VPSAILGGRRRGRRLWDQVVDVILCREPVRRIFAEVDAEVCQPVFEFV